MWYFSTLHIYWLKLSNFFAHDFEITYKKPSPACNISLLRKILKVYCHIKSLFIKKNKEMLKLRTNVHIKESFFTVSFSKPTNVEQLKWLWNSNKLFHAYMPNIKTRRLLNMKSLGQKGPIALLIICLFISTASAKNCRYPRVKDFNTPEKLKWLFYCELYAK